MRASTTLLATTVLIAGVGAWAPAPAGADPVTVTFEHTGAVQEFVVPAGVEQVEVVACGASGGSSFSSPPAILAGSGGAGGRALRSLSVTPGETLAVFVGGRGGNGGFDAGSGAAGWNGGGAGVQGFGGGGGGASDVRQGGLALGDRVVVGGGGGGGGVAVNGFTSFPLVGGEGGGLEGGAGTTDSTPATQTGPGTGPGGNGTLGSGGPGGGGGLYGGAGGFNQSLAPGISALIPGGGGSGLGDSFGPPGSCATQGWVSISYEAPAAIPVVTPFGALAFEGGGGSSFVDVPVFLSEPSTDTVTVDWATVDDQVAGGLATSGLDFVAASGTVTFVPGDTVEHVTIEILDDGDDEAPLLWGEWALIWFDEPSDATLDTTTFFGHGLFVIVDDDP